MPNGSCHCGNIAFEFDGEIGEVLECNCSICVRKGSLLHFVPQSAFRLSTPPENVSTYKFNKHIIAHHFCANCGVAPYAQAQGPDGTPMAAINVRCVEGIDPRQLQIKFFNGRDR